MSAAANAAAFLNLQARLHSTAVRAERHSAPPPAVSEPRAPRVPRAEPRSVRVTYRRGRLAASP